MFFPSPHFLLPLVDPHEMTSITPQPPALATDVPHPEWPLPDILTSADNGSAKIVPWPLVDPLSIRTLMNQPPFLAYFPAEATPVRVHPKIFHFHLIHSLQRRHLQRRHPSLGRLSQHAQHQRRPWPRRRRFYLPTHPVGSEITIDSSKSASDRRKRSGGLFSQLWPKSKIGLRADSRVTLTSKRG